MSDLMTIVKLFMFYHLYYESQQPYDVCLQFL